MAPLTLQDTEGYVSERLRIAGANGDPIFNPDALQLIYRYSGGIPRVINLLCEHALITAYAEDQRPVLAETIQAVAHEFELDKSPAEGVQSPEEEERRTSPAVGSLQNLGQLMDRMRKGS